MVKTKNLSLPEEEFFEDPPENSREAEADDDASDASDDETQY